MTTDISERGQKSHFFLSGCVGLK